jgi:hypothetical protein
MVAFDGQIHCDHAKDGDTVLQTVGEGLLRPHLPNKSSGSYVRRNGASETDQPAAAAIPSPLSFTDCAATSIPYSRAIFSPRILRLISGVRSA